MPLTRSHGRRFTGPLLAAAFLAALGGPPAQAVPLRLLVEPQTAQIGFILYVVGMFPMPASFQKFHGTMDIDEDNPQFCQVDVVIDATSIHMEAKIWAQRSQAADMMDVADFPTLHFVGSCRFSAAHTNELSGNLTMRGVTRPLVLNNDQHGGTIVSTGSLRRYDFGINGLQGLVGRAITLKFSILVPPKTGKGGQVFPSLGTASPRTGEN